MKSKQVEHTLLEKKILQCIRHDFLVGLDYSFKVLETSVVNKDLSLKAKARGQGLDIRTRSRTALDYGVRENIELRKSNSTVAQVHAINTLFTDLWSTVESFMR